MSSSCSLSEIQRRIDEVRRFLCVTLSIANAHTVEFYTQDVWSRFTAVEPQEVLTAVSAFSDQQRAPPYKERDQSKTTFGFCRDSNRLVDAHELLQAAQAHSLPGLPGVCMSRDELLRALRGTREDAGAELPPDEFMNSKKSHEVQSMSEVVACLARRCGVKQVIDVGSGKGYLSSFLSLRYGLHVYGIDSSSTNTHGAQERNRKLKKFSRAYQKHSKAAAARAALGEATDSLQEELEEIIKPGMNGDVLYRDGAAGAASQEEEEVLIGLSDVDPAVETHSEPNAEPEELFLSALSLDAIQTTSPRVPPGQLSADERERRKRENLERKARNRTENGAGNVFSPLTSYVTAETELRELINELEDAVMVGLHTCGDLAPSTLRMFVAKTELAAVCSVGCCYHLLSEEFDPSATQECFSGVCGFPLSQYLRLQSWFCGRNARMSACLALERVSLGQGIQMESLFYRAVLHVILRDHYGSFKSEKRVGNVYSKAKSFVDYVRRALRRLELDESKLSDRDIQDYHDTYRPRMDEMHAFNMLKVALAPCIEGLILLDRLCYLKEQEDLSFSALVQLFDPLLSPRCYAVIGLKSYEDRTSS
ncbi:putative methyltransferase-like protein 25 [Symphorus nematophorus]